MYTLYKGHSEDILKNIPSDSVDLVVTSPPYDDIKNYDNSNCFTFDVFTNIADELYRVVKPGGVVVWVVADKLFRVGAKKFIGLL